MPQAPAALIIGVPFIELQSVDSTNNYARKQIDASRLTEGQHAAKHGMVVFAHEQTAGKGQRGRAWFSEKATSLTMSIVLEPPALCQSPHPLSFSNQFELNATIAVSVKEWLSTYGGRETTIKWPNDIYWRDRKAGGILIESIISNSPATGASWEWVIVGIGININQENFPAWLPNPVSLRQITGKQFDVLLLARDLCSFFNKNLDHLLTEGFDSLFASYNKNLFGLNKKRKFKAGPRQFMASVKAVSRSGKLVLVNGMEEEFDFGELEWLD